MPSNPITEKHILRAISDYFLATSLRNYVMWQLGLKTGLRISDILALRVDDVRGREFIELTEKKTKKSRKVPLKNLKLRAALRDFCADRHAHEFLIKSRNGVNRAITRTQAYMIIRNVGIKLGIPNLGTHSMRKSLGMRWWQEGKDLNMLRLILNHSSLSETLSYCGIQKEASFAELAAFDCED